MGGSAELTDLRFAGSYHVHCAKHQKLFNTGACSAREPKLAARATGRDECAQPQDDCPLAVPALQRCLLYKTACSNA